MKVCWMDGDAAVLTFEAGWFGPQNAFWHKVETAEVKPCIEAFARSYALPEEGEVFDLAWRRRGRPSLLDPDYLARLAESTEARFGKEG